MKTALVLSLTGTSAVASAPHQTQLRAVVAETHEAQTALFQHKPAIARRLIADALRRDEHLRHSCDSTELRQVATELNLARGEVKAGLLGPANAELAKVRAPAAPGC
ncbi:MAG TPA: hypothetical protein VGM90_21540 [Kofleriaceae bacterium]